MCGVKLSQKMDRSQKWHLRQLTSEHCIDPESVEYFSAGVFVFDPIDERVGVSFTARSVNYSQGRPSVGLILEIRLEVLFQLSSRGLGIKRDHPGAGDLGQLFSTSGHFRPKVDSHDKLKVTYVR